LVIQDGDSFKADCGCMSQLDKEAYKITKDDEGYNLLTNIKNDDYFAAEEVEVWGLTEEPEIKA
jgi:hypothetical protein